jgi:RNA polymerase sigma factor (sigma-70 family)
MTPLLSTPLLRAQSDARLTALAGAGHDRAFEAIVERYRKPLSRYLRRLLSELLAEDVLQATFVRAWQALESGTEVRDLRPWLYRIAHNQAVNALRAAGSALPAAADEPAAASTEAQVERREELRQALHGIGALPDRQRAALVAVAVDDRPHADVAAELGLTDGALRQLLLRARTALRTAATALTPYPLLAWLSAGSEVSAARVAEVAAGAGGIGVAVKAGAAVLAAGAVVAGAPALRDESATSRATSVITEQTSPAAHTVTAADDRRDRGEAEPGDAGGGRAGEGSGRGRSGDDGHRSGSSGRGSGDDRSGSGDDGRSGSSGSGSGDDDRSGSSGSGSGDLGDSGDSGSSGSGPGGADSTSGERESGDDRLQSSDGGGERDGGDDGLRSGGGESSGSGSDG